MATDISRETASPTREGELHERSSGWGGWIVFASVMMIVVGGLNAIHGLVAIVNDDWVVWTNRGDIYLDLTTWGWIHLGIGVAVVLAGFGLLTGSVLARAIAVLVASVSIVANFLSLPGYPVWALTIIAVDVLVIYALTAHGRDLA